MNHPLTSNLHPTMAAALSPALFARDATVANPARSEAIAMAEAHLNNAGLPPLQEAVSAMREMLAAFGNCGSPRQQDAADWLARIAAEYEAR